MHSTEKGKPAERRGRKATGLRDVPMTAGLPGATQDTRFKCPQGVLRTWMAAAIAATIGVPAFAAPPALNSVAPDFALKGIDGRNLRLSEYRGEPMVLHFWASWCGPCRESVAALDALGRSSGTPVLGVNLDGCRPRGRGGRFACTSRRRRSSTRSSPWRGRTTSPSCHSRCCSMPRATSARPGPASRPIFPNSPRNSNACVRTDGVPPA